MRLALTFHAVFLVLLVCSCGVDRKIEITQTIPDEVITVDNSIRIVPDESRGTSVEEIKPFVASSVTAVFKVIKISGGYQLNASWEFEGREPNYWIMETYSDLNDGQSNVSSHFSTAYSRRGENRVFASRLLERNRQYKFLVEGKITDSTGAAVVDAAVIYKTVRVDLRGLP